MNTLPQVLKSRIAFRCEDWFSEAVRIEAVKRRSSLQKFCTEAIMAQLGLSRPSKRLRAARKAEEADRG
jgi:hypothetical protein